VRKYWAIFKGSIQNSFVYRADTFFWSLGEFLDTIVFLFIWLIIYGEKQVIAGFSLPQTITYLVGVGMVSNIIFVWIHNQMESDVQTGQLSAILIKPVSYPLARMVSGLASKPLDLMLRTIIYFLVALAFRNKFIVNTDLLSWLLFFFSLILAFMVNFLVNFTIGCLAFWTTLSRGMANTFRTIISIFSGAYAPIAFFPLWFQALSKVLPFSYTRYFPMLIYLNKLTSLEIFEGLGIQILWVLVLFFFARFVWHRGVKRYEGVGI